MIEITNKQEALAAIRRDRGAFEHVPENLRTPEICLEAVKNWGWALAFVPENLKTAEVCLEAVKQPNWAMQHAPYRGGEFGFEAITQDSRLLKHVSEPLRGEVLRALKSGD